MGEHAGLRVALVVGESTGGIGGHVRSLAAGLVAAGCRVVVCAPEGTARRFDLAATGAAVAALPPDPLPLRALAAVRAVRRVAGGVDVVHAHGLRAGLLASTAARGRPVVVTLHNAVLATGPGAAALRPVEALVARRARVVLGASSDLVARARALGAPDARLGPVAAPPLPPPGRSRDEVRAELGVGDRPLVLAAARLAPQKGYRVLLDAAAAWTVRDPVPFVAVAGDGPEREPMAGRVLAEGLPVHLLGHRADVADLLGAADVVVLTSWWEARALVAQEALRAGVPLVATAVGGVPELVGDAALLVPPGDPPAVAAAVARLLDDPALRARLVTAGRERAARWPDEAATVAHVLGVYRELVARGRDGRAGR